MNRKPFSGIRVLDFTRLYAGPYCTMQLGDLGADVVKLEMPGGDPLRHQGPPFLHEQSMSFLVANRNKRSIVLDLKKAEDLEVARKLALKADVIVENFRPGVMDRMGLGYKALSEANPRLVFAAMSGLGASGPDKDRGAFDIIVQAEFGYMSITGEKGGSAIKQGTSIFDLVCGLNAFGAIASALYQRENTGKGQLIETSLMEGEVSFLADAAMEFFVTGNNRGRWGSEHSNIVPYKVFKTLDGEMVVAAGYQNLFEAFAKAMKVEDLITDPRFATHSDRIKNRDELYPILDRLIGEYKTANLIEILDAAGVPCAPVNNMEAVFSHPQVLHRDMLRKIPHPVRGNVPSIGPAVKYSGFDVAAEWSAPPALGEHSTSAIDDWLKAA